MLIWEFETSLHAAAHKQMSAICAAILIGAAVPARGHTSSVINYPRAQFVVTQRFNVVSKCSRICIPLKYVSGTAFVPNCSAQHNYVVQFGKGNLFRRVPDFDLAHECGNKFIDMSIGGVY